MDEAKFGKDSITGAIGLRGSGCLGEFKETLATAFCFRLKLLRDTATLLAILKESRFKILYKPRDKKYYNTLLSKFCMGGGGGCHEQPLSAIVGKPKIAYQ